MAAVAPGAFPIVWNDSSVFQRQCLCRAYSYAFSAQNALFGEDWLFYGQVLQQSEHKVRHKLSEHRVVLKLSDKFVVSYDKFLCI